MATSKTFGVRGRTEPDSQQAGELAAKRAFPKSIVLQGFRLAGSLGSLGPSPPKGARLFQRYTSTNSPLHVYSIRFIVSVLFVAQKYLGTIGVSIGKEW